MAQNILAEAPVRAQNNLEARTDLQLVAAVNSGDSAAFEVLYFRYRDWVLALACRFTGDHDAALDVMQETFLYLLRKFPGFRLTANLKTFLYPAVRHLALAARQKAQRYHTGEDQTEALEQTPSPSSVAAADQDLAAVLASLSEEHREVLLMRFVDGLSLAEIALAAGVPLGTVKSRLHNALRALRQDERAREFFEP